MGIESGIDGSSTALITREVRWFRHGSLPPCVLQWLMDEDHSMEERIDVYDLAAARNGVGRKQRGGTNLDSKFRMVAFRPERLAPNLLGHVEDWMKISEPLIDEAPSHAMAEPLRVTKVLTTRRVALEAERESGCEVELAQIEAAGIEAWSLCFETFGVPDRRNEALLAGLEAASRSPFPNDYALDDSLSYAYPHWITRLHDHQRDVPSATTLT